MTELEIKRVIEMIKDIGAQSIVFSGGEPLMRDKKEILDILKHAKELELGVGILTSGFMQDGDSIDDELAAGLQSYCDWVHFSIDSFLPTIYSEIRKRKLEKCIASLEQIHRRIPQKIEICFTIQKRNIKSLLDGSEIKACRQIEERLGGALNIRLKFAHGSDDQSRFLLTPDDIKKFMRSDVLLPWGKRYFEVTMNKVFTREDIALGLPVTKAIMTMKETDRCYALYDTLFISANGDVYPCCHLFDDNVGDSPYREKYCLGSVVDHNVGTVPLPSEYNILRQIWECDKLTKLRRQNLPILKEACCKCLRYINYNVFANRVVDVLDSERDWLEQGGMKEAHVLHTCSD